MTKNRQYVPRNEIHKRLMANPMAKSYWNLSEDKQNESLDEIMQTQYLEAVKFVSQIIANYLYRNVLAIPLKIRLKYTACRIPLIPLTDFKALNFKRFIK